MAEQTSGKVRISASSDAVEQVIADFDNYPVWTGGMGAPEVSARTESGLPATAAFTVSGGGINDRVTLNYEWSDGQVSWHLVSAQSIAALDGTYLWREVEGATEVEYRLTLELKAALPSFLRTIAEKTIIMNALQGLKKRVEAVA